MRDFERNKYTQRTSMYATPTAVHLAWRSSVAITTAAFIANLAPKVIHGQTISCKQQNSQRRL